MKIQSDDIQDLIQALDNITQQRSDFSGYTLLDSLAIIADALHVLSEKVSEKSEQ